MLSFLYGENKTWRRKVSPWGILYGHAYYLVGPVTGKRKPVLWRFDKIIDIQIAGRASLPCGLVRGSIRIAGFWRFSGKAGTYYSEV